MSVKGSRKQYHRKEIARTCAVGSAAVYLSPPVAPPRSPLPLLAPVTLLYSGLASADVLQRGRPLTPKPPLPTGSRLREEGRSRKRSKAGYLGTRIVPVLRSTVRDSAEGRACINRATFEFCSGEKPQPPQIPTISVGISTARGSPAP